jgi:hypothetical protein
MAGLGSEKVRTRLMAGFGKSSANRHIVADSHAGLLANLLIYRKIVREKH